LVEADGDRLLIGGSPAAILVSAEDHVVSACFPVLGGEHVTAGTSVPPILASAKIRLLDELVDVDGIHPPRSACPGPRHHAFGGVDVEKSAIIVGSE